MQCRENRTPHLHSERVCFGHGADDRRNVLSDMLRLTAGSDMFGFHIRNPVAGLRVVVMSDEWMRESDAGHSKWHENSGDAGAGAKGGL